MIAEGTPRSFEDNPRDRRRAFLTAFGPVPNYEVRAGRYPVDYEGVMPGVAGQRLAAHAVAGAAAARAAGLLGEDLGQKPELAPAVAEGGEPRVGGGVTIVGDSPSRTTMYAEGKPVTVELDAPAMEYPAPLLDFDEGTVDGDFINLGGGQVLSVGREGLTWTYGAGAEA